MPAKSPPHGGEYMRIKKKNNNNNNNNNDTFARFKSVLASNYWWNPGGAILYRLFVKCND